MTNLRWRRQHSPRIVSESLAIRTTTGMAAGHIRRRSVSVSVKPVNARSLANFPCQANGAEMLRIACCMLVEAGVELCAPIHDAVLIEGPADTIDEEVEKARAIMAEASRIVLNGFEVGTDVVVVRYPDRYADEAGVEFWNRVTRLAGPLEVRQ
jgi:DNA polymerase-1